MGGFGSGRHGGRPTADMSLRIDLAWMLRTGRASEGHHTSGTLYWSCGGEPSGSISYVARMDEPGQERLELSYWRGEGKDREHVQQTVRLTFTRPRLGGKRWWMICPYSGLRVGKLYKPPGGDRFAGRKAWRLGYASQRLAHHDRPFESARRIQRKLGCDEGWGGVLTRPKGMHHATFQRHLDRYLDLEEQSNAYMWGLINRLKAMG